jgi:hypothetical protein
MVRLSRLQKEPEDLSPGTFEPGMGWDRLHLPRWVGESERAQILGRIDSFVEKLLQYASSGVEQLLGCCRRLSRAKPLRPVWVGRDTAEAVLAAYEREGLAGLDFVPIICVSVSRVEVRSYSVARV